MITTLRPYLISPFLNLVALNYDLDINGIIFIMDIIITITL